jgi:phytoene synthase
VSRFAERELDAAGINDASLRADYLLCRALNARHGRTYYLATLLLPAAKRPAVHALYGFARWVDDVVDEGRPALSNEAKAHVIEDVRTHLREGAVPRPDQPAPVRAARDAMSRWDIPLDYFTAFLDSMQMDLSVSQYETYADLEKYMWGSAAVIGLQMLPILGGHLPTEIAEPYAIDLGLAFQLTNFLRDVGEDLARGRIYLPQQSLRYHGVDRARLERGVVDGPIRRLLADEIARTRELYRSALHGVRLLDPTSRPCVSTALTLYRDILAEIEDRDYQVLHGRASVPTSRRLRVALPGLVAAVRSRH